MKVKILFSLLTGILVVCAGDKDTKETKDSKEKRQIGLHQTRISPHQAIPDSDQLETVYGAHPSQFVIHAVGQGQPPQYQHHQHPQQVSVQPEQLQEVARPQYTYVPEAVQPQQGKNAPSSKQFPKKAHQRPIQYTEEPLQYIPQSYQEQPYQLISEEQILRLLQEELRQQSIQIENKQSASKPVKVAASANQKQGLGNYREVNLPINNVQYSYAPQSIPQHQYYAPHPLDYHRAVPDHPLAVSSLERELEKLVESNKPTVQYQQQQQQQFQQHQQQVYKASKPQPKIYSSTPVPIQQEEKGFSFFPDFAQLSGYTGPQSFLDQPSHTPKMATPNHGQYLTEVAPKHKLKSSSSPFHQKSQLYAVQQKSSSQYAPVSENKNAAVKVIQAPALQYEKPRIVNQPAAELQYYKASNSESVSQQQHHEEPPSRSSIFVSQGTGIQKVSQQKPYGAQKVIRLPPPDGKPITQAEFQALVDAGFPVQAVPVPVPVPYEKYIENQYVDYRQNLQQDQDNGLRRIKEARQGITHLHPVALRQEQEKESTQKIVS